MNPVLCQLPDNRPRKLLGLGVGIRTNGEGQRFTGHLNLKPEPPRAPFAGQR